MPDSPLGFRRSKTLDEKDGQSDTNGFPSPALRNPSAIGAELYSTPDNTGGGGVETLVAPVVT
jgi:hypothetical protein